MNTITEAAILSFSELKRLPKKSGIVFESMCCVITLVLLPRIIQARREPKSALPIPIQVEARPKFQPN